MRLEVLYQLLRHRKFITYEESYKIYNVSQKIIIRYM